LPPLPGLLIPTVSHIAFQLPLSNEERVHAELLPEMEDRLALADERTLRIDRGDEVLDAGGI